MQCGSVRFSALFGGQGLTSLGCHGCRDATTPDDITLSYDITMTFGISRPPEFCEACGRANDASVEPCSFLLVLTPCHRSRRRRYEMMEKRPCTGWPPVRGKALQGMLLAGLGGPSVSVYHTLRGRRTRLRGRQRHERAETYIVSPLG